MSSLSPTRWQPGHIAQRSGRTTPEKLTSLELFATPGVEITDFGAGQKAEARATVVAKAWNFNPAEIVVPAGAVTTFYLTSRDVLHGFQVEGTDINVELIPGEISALTYTFNEPGVYRTICNEYCSFGHQNMLGVVRVLAPGELAQATANAAPETVDVGKSVYTTNCASCHQANGQGTAGVFPPLARHAAELYKAERSYLPKLLLYGLEGQIAVGGENYNGQMPACSPHTLPSSGIRTRVYIRSPLSQPTRVAGATQPETAYSLVRLFRTK